MKSIYINLLLSIKAFGQTSHLYGNSPVCFLVWIFNLVELEKPAEQTPHVNSRIPVCACICCFKAT